MLWGLGVGGEIQLKITHSLTHSLCQTINLCIKPGLNTFFPYLPSLTSLSHCSKSCHCLSVRIWGEVQRREYFSRFKMAPCPFEAWWLFNPKPDRNLPLLSQKWKENMLQNIRLQGNGRRSPISDNNMNDSCVKIYWYLEGCKREISFVLADFLFHSRSRKFRNVPCFECKSRTMSYYGASRDFWNKVVVGLRFRLRRG